MSYDGTHLFVCNEGFLQRYDINITGSNTGPREVSLDLESEPLFLGTGDWSIDAYTDPFTGIDYLVAAQGGTVNVYTYNQATGSSFTFDEQVTVSGIDFSGIRFGYDGSAAYFVVGDSIDGDSATT